MGVILTTYKSWDDPPSIKGLLTTGFPSRGDPNYLLSGMILQVGGLVFDSYPP